MPKPSSAPNAALPSPMGLRFVKDVWPLLTKPGASCVDCHNAKNPSQLHFPADAASSYQMLLAGGRFKADNPASLLNRVAAPDDARRMPPSGMPGWPEADVAVLRAFMADLEKQPQQVGAGSGDEPFPSALLTPYRGPKPRGVPGADNTFLTYHQLRRKVKTLFDDDWYRDGRDLFVENAPQFGGADFIRRYDESTRPTPAYLSAAREMARDVAARAFLNRAGPFTGAPAVMPMPGQVPEKAVREEIGRLYRRLLFREPSPTEVKEAVTLLGSVMGARKSLEGQTEPLRFTVDVSDEGGLRTSRQIKIDMLPAKYGLATHYVDESQADKDSVALPGTYTLKAGDVGQRLEVTNLDTVGVVSFRNVTLRGPLPEKTETVIGPDTPGVRADGAWRPSGERAKDGYDDDNNNKGRNRLIVALPVKKTGKYEIQFGWRKSGDGARNVPVTVSSYDPNRLALRPAAAVPPKGEAHFKLDQTDDTIQYKDLETAFQFDSATKNAGVEISNAGTRRRVVADAVTLVPATAPDGDPALVIKANDAEGHEKWKVFKAVDFSAYNTIGPDLLSDENAHKGELSLLYAPSRALPLDKLYRTRINFPGRAENETETPVIVRALRSSPIVAVRAPAAAPIGASVTLDAASSYNVQHSQLRYAWRQTGGPKVALVSPASAVAKFVMPAREARQEAWVGLCRALILHPDFLFSRPRSLATTRDPKVRSRLQLVKIAQDLVGRPPTGAELTRLERGASLGALVDAYLASPEFDEFYYRRVRLYLESHGTVSQDEPARLWRYIMAHGRPFKEIITADYTVDPAGKKQERPAYHGRTGVLTMKGFIDGKQGLPHFNYAAQVCEKFLGYVFEVTPEIVKARGTLTASSTVDPKSLCYTCHQVLTPLAYQRTRWTDGGVYKEKEDWGPVIDDSDRDSVAAYPFKGKGLEAFALAAQRTERFDRAIIQIHFVWYFGREMRYDADERGLYKRLWDTTHRDHYKLKGLIRALVTSPEYLGDAPIVKKGGMYAHR
jgi:hypothetical protein